MMWALSVDFYALSLLSGSQTGLWIGLMFVEGFLIGGPYMVISAAIATDLVRFSFSISDVFKGKVIVVKE